MPFSLREMFVLAFPVYGRAARRIYASKPREPHREGLPALFPGVFQNTRFQNEAGRYIVAFFRFLKKVKEAVFEDAR